MEGVAKTPVLGVPLKAAFGLRVQILLGLALVTVFAVLSTGYLTLWAGGASLRLQRESNAMALAAAAAGNATIAVDITQPLESPENRAKLDTLARELFEQASVAQVSFISKGAQAIVSRPARLEGDVDPPLLVGVLAGIPPVFHYRTRPGSGGIELLAYAPITTRGQVLGAARVVLSAPSPATTVIQRSGWLLGALALAQAGVMLGLGYLVITQLVVRPLQIVERATARVTAGDWDHRVAPDGPREVIALATSFNQMTASLASQREQLIRTEKLASVGQLAAGVAHEIGNPLAAILGYVDLLRADAGAPTKAALSAEESRDALDRVKAETQRIHRIIQDLLEYSRPSREDAQSTDPLHVLRASRTLLEPQVRFRGVTVVEGAGPWPRVLVSPGRLQQVFVNLLMNAADAMGGEGTIVVSSERADDGRVRIALADTGPGISPELKRKIFDPFFTTKAPGQGTGLGLAISRSIVESFGGNLELGTSTPGSGATFVVTLPAESPPLADSV